jgi:hypothetical protein
MFPGLGDAPNLVLVNEEIRRTIARQPQHHVVEVLNPAAHRLTVPQLYIHDHLAIAQRAQIESFLAGLSWRGRLGTAAACEWGFHIQPF